jgi:phage-related protein
MNYTIEYFHSRVKAEIESWPDGILADFARIMELLMEFGPNLRMPHSRAMGGGLFELKPRGREGIGRVFYCFAIGQRVVLFPRSRKEDTRNAGAGIESCPEKTEGGSEWLN